MLNDTILRELVGYNSKSPILSVYLNTDQTEGSKDIHLELRKLLKGIDMPQDEQVILDYFEQQRDITGRSLAMFSCAVEGFFRAYPLALPTRSLSHVSNQPYLKPLADLLDDYGHYGIVLVDKKSARLFTFHLGALTETESITGEAVRHVKRGGASTMPGHRGGIAGRTHHEEEVEHRNLRDAAEKAAKFFEQNHIRRILLGGQDDNIAIFRAHLPKSWQSLIVGTFPMSLTASVKDILSHVMSIGQESERQREDQLVDLLLTSALKNNGAVVRLDKTLNAIHDRRVQTLLVSDEFHAAGCRCESCGYLTEETIARCPVCGQAVSVIDDAVEMAIHGVMRAGGNVEIIHNNPRLAQVGIGGLMRY